MPLRIVIVGFDFNSLTQKNPAEVLRKYRRDRLNPDHNEMLVLGFAGHSGSGALSSTVRYRQARAYSSHLRPVYDFLLLFFLPYALLRERFRPDVFVIGDTGFAAAVLLPKLILGAKVFFYLGNLPRSLARSTDKQFRFYYQVVTEWVARVVVDRAFTISQDTSTYARRYFGLGEAAVDQFFPDTISQDGDLFEQSERGQVRAQLGIPSESKIIFSVGRFEPEKNFEGLIRTFAGLGLPNTVLVIVGQGKLKGSLEELVSQSGLKGKVFLASPTSRGELWGYFRDADVFMLLSMSEGLGLVLHEAIHAGLPLFASPVGGMRDTIGSDGERGYYYQAGGDQELLKTRMQAALSRSGDVPAMIERATQFLSALGSGQKTINNFFT